ncbi:MAG TPA: AsmA family protein [Tepidisphaeraceae bacterium]
MQWSKSSKLRRRSLRVLSTLVVVLLIGVVVGIGWGGLIVHDLLRDKLQMMVSDHLNGRLDLGTIEYTFPYGVRVNDVALMADDDGKPLVLTSFKRLDIQLTKLPLWPGPLQIERIDVNNPTIHLIRTQEGFVGDRGLIRSAEEKRISKRPPSNLSDIFHLRRLTLQNARVEYEDRRIANTAPLVWENLYIDLNASPQSGASHAFDFAAASGTLATVASQGQLDLDTLVLTLDGLTIKTALNATDDTRTSPLPAEAQKILKQLNIAGSAAVVVNGIVPLRNLDAMVVTAGLTVEDAQSRLPGLPEAINDFDLVAHATIEEGKATATLTHMGFRYVSTGVSIQPTTAILDPATMRWTVTPFRMAVAYIPTGATTKPVLEQPVTLMLVAAAEQGEAIDDATIRLDGTAVALPTIGGELGVSGALAYTRGEATLLPTTVTGLGGKIDVTGALNVKNQALVTNVNLQGVDLAKLKALANPADDREMRGNLNGQLTASILGGDLDTFRSSGVINITEGQFARIPVLADITQFLGIGGGAFVAERVTTEFDIAKKVMTLDRLAVSTSTFQIRGAGTIDFEQNLNLLVNIGTTSDWGGRVSKTHSPLFSDAAGAVAGGTQGMIRKATSQFTSVRVGGNIEKPQIAPAPAPIIGETFDQLFRRPTPVKETTVKSE